jgi:hypothetical protein
MKAQYIKDIQEKHLELKILVSLVRFQVVPHPQIARPCRSMICEAFLRLVDGSVDGFKSSIS